MSKFQSKTAETRYVYRLSHGSTQGWQVRLPAKISTAAGAPRSKFFPDLSWGGQDKALTAALKYRKRLASSHGYPEFEMTHKKNFGQPEAVGILLIDLKRSNNLTDWMFCAFWSPPDEGQCKTTFSVNRHGFEGAFKKAVAARERNTKEKLSDEAILQTGVLASLRLCASGLDFLKKK